MKVVPFLDSAFVQLTVLLSRGDKCGQSHVVYCKEEGKVDPFLDFTFVQLTVLSRGDKCGQSHVVYCKEEGKVDPLLDFSFVQLTVLSREDECRHSLCSGGGLLTIARRGKVDPGEGHGLFSTAYLIYSPCDFGPSLRPLSCGCGL